MKSVAFSYLHERGFQLADRHWIAPRGYKYCEKDASAIRLLFRQCGCPCEVIQGVEIVPPPSRRH